jgi:cathepsin L
MFRLVQLYLLFSGILFSVVSNEVFPTFDEYIQLYHKNYSHRLRNNREQIYNDNIHLIREHNLNPQHTWKMGINDFTDLTWDEFWLGRQSIRTSTIETFVDSVQLPVRNLPLTVNWSRFMNPVQDQGKCGSCWAFSAMASIESAYAIQTRRLWNLSRQQPVDCAPRTYGCNGGWMHYAYQYATRNFICSAVSYPYQDKQSRCQQKQCIGRLKLKKTKPFTGERNLAIAVAQQPIAIALGVSSAFQHYKNGVFDAPCPRSPNHAVVVVGYTSTEWLIQNSWGTTWGEQGWMRIIRNKGMCGIGRYRSDLLFF